MAIVKTYHVGKSVVHYDDRYCVKTQEEIDKILYEVGVIWANSEIRKAFKKAEEAQKEAQKSE